MWVSQLLQGELIQSNCTRYVDVEIAKLIKKIQPPAPKEAPAALPSQDLIDQIDEEGFL